MQEISESLKQAKEALAAKDCDGAIKLLSNLKDAAISDYPLCVKISKISDKAVAGAASLRPLKLALMSSSTLTFLAPILRYFLAAAGFGAEIKYGDFNSWRGEISDGNSWVYSFAPDIAIIATNWRDAAAPAFAPDPEAEADRIAREFSGFWKIFKSRSSAALIQAGFDAPGADAAGFLSQTDPKSRTQVLRRANLKMLKLAQKAGVTILDAMEVRAGAGAACWDDARMWLSARQHPSFSALPRLAAEYARAVSALLKPQKKVCVLDLDNTLWGGVVGEDGIGGIKIGAPDPEGEAYAEFQKFLLELKGRGVLLAACSKNNPEDALAPFENHPDMLIKRSDFAAFKANWNPKSQNISEIARELNLGSDSFVFVDDNPAEIAEVAAAMPEVAVLLLPPDPSEYARALASKNFFDTANLSEDDLRRHATYLENAQRNAALSGSADPNEFLRNLGMLSSPAPISETNIARAAQLAGKTNQFNLTTRRHSQEAIREIAKRPGAYAKTFSLKDKFGDMGIVGLLIAERAGDGALEIDTFLLSCRALGRTLEKFMAADLLAFAKNRGYAHIRGVYVPTAKNAQTAGLFERLGFTKEGGAPDGHSTWLLEVANAPEFDTFVGGI